MSFVRLQHASVPMPAGGNDKARAFYGGVLGLDEIPTPSTLDSEQIVWFSVGGNGHEVHVFTEEGFGPHSAGQHLCLEVDEIESVRQQLDEKGVTIEETTPIHNRPRFNVTDPFGNRIELTQIQGDYA